MVGEAPHGGAGRCGLRHAPRIEPVADAVSLQRPLRRRAMAKPKVDVPPALMTTAELRALPLGPMRRSGPRGAWSVPAGVQPYRVGTAPMLVGLASASFFGMVSLLDGDDAAVRLASGFAFTALRAIEPR